MALARYRWNDVKRMASNRLYPGFNPRHTTGGLGITRYLKAIRRRLDGVARAVQRDQVWKRAGWAELWGAIPGTRLAKHAQR